MQQYLMRSLAICGIQFCLIKRGDAWDDVGFTTVTSVRGSSVIVAWLKSGAVSSEFGVDILPVIERQCLKCHSAEAAQQLAKLPLLDSYQEIKKVADVDTGLSLLTRVKLSHMHLPGIGLVLPGIGSIFCLAELQPLIKYALIVTPFIAILADSLAWYLTKWDPVYTYTVVIAGGLLGASMAAQILISLYQIWFLKPVKQFEDFK